MSKYSTYTCTTQELSQQAEADTHTVNLNYVTAIKWYATTGMSLHVVQRNKVTLCGSHFSIKVTSRVPTDLHLVMQCWPR